MVSLPTVPGLNAELQPFHEQTYRRSYAPEVERWRSKAEQYLRPADADKLLHVISYESGGNPGAVNPESGAQGLLQMLPSHGFNGHDPDTAFKWAADQVANHGWTDWGEGVTYQGKPFGALGFHPYEGGAGSAGAVGNSALDTRAGPGIRMSVSPATPQRYSNEPGQLFEPGRDLQPVQSGDVPFDAGGLVPAGLEDQPLRAAGTLRERLRGTQLQPGLGSVPATPHTEDTSNPLDLAMRAYDAGNVDIPVVSDAMRAVQPVVGDAAELAGNYLPTGIAFNAARSGLEAVGGPSLPKAGDVTRFAAEGLVPVGALDVGLTLAPGVGQGEDIARLATAGAREGAVRAGASSTLDRLLPAGLLADERRGANVVESLGGTRTQGARIGQEFGPEVAGGPAKPPAASAAPAPARGAPLPELGDQGIRDALALKEEATLQPGRVFGDEGSLQRKVVGALNPSVDMPREVHVANQARTGVQSVLRSELTQAEVPAYRKLASVFESEHPRYIGPEGRPLANTWVDYAENPRFYEAPEALTAAKEALRAVQDASLGRVRESFGVDIGRFEAGHDPEAVYIPHIAARDQATTAIASTEKSISSRGSVAKERAYDSLSDRVAKHPDWKPELDPAVLADNHASALANMAANNTFKSGVGGKTLTEVIDETHPGLRDARDKMAARVQNIKARIDSAEEAVTRHDATLAPLIKEQAAIDNRATPRFVSLSEADQLTPELKTMRTQLNELGIRARAIDKAVERTQGKGAAAGLRLNDAQSELGQLIPQLEELRGRYNSAAPGDYVRGSDFRYHPPKVAEAMHSVMKPAQVDNAFIDTAIQAGNTARAAGLGPDFSPLTIQGALGALSHPEVAIKNAAGLARAAFQTPEEFAKLLDPALVQRFEFASNRRIGSLGNEDLANAGKGLRLPGQPGKKFNDALQRVVDYGTLKAFENDSRLVSDPPAILRALGIRPATTANLADHEAASSLSKIIPRIDNAAQGRSAQRVAMEGALPTSRSFTAQPFALAKDWTSAVAKISTLKGSEVTGREALALIRGSALIGSLMTLSIGSAVLSADANGRDPIEAVKEVTDPSSGKFMHLILGDKGSVGLGGPFRSAFLGVFRTATQGPDGAIRYGRGRLAPALGAITDVVTNTDYRGNPVRTGSDWHQVLQSIGHIAQSANLLIGGVAQGIGDNGVQGAVEQGISGGLGVNYQERNPSEVRDRAAREKFGKPYGELFPQDKAAIDALGLAPQSEYKKRADEVHAPIAAEQKRVEDLFAQGNLDKRLPEYYHDLGQRKLQAGHDLETQFAKDFAGFDKNKYRSALDGYYGTEKKDEGGSPDFDATEAARQDYLAGLPEDQRRWISEALGVSRENQTPLRQEYLTYIDAKKKAGYFRDGLTPRERTALDAAHVDLDLQAWYFNGGVKDKSGGQLNSKDAVDQALQMIEQRKLPNRAVYINGADRDMALPENRQFWQDKGSLIANFTGDAYSRKYGDQEAQKQYTRGNVKSPRYADLSAGEKAEVDAAIRREVKAGNPELEAVMAYAGVGGNPTDKVYAVDAAAAPFVTELNKKYGKTVPKAGWQIVQRR